MLKIKLNQTYRYQKQEKEKLNFYHKNDVRSKVNVKDSPQILIVKFN